MGETALELHAAVEVFMEVGSGWVGEGGSLAGEGVLG